MSKILMDISNINPIGVDSKYEDIYMEVEVEIDKSVSGISREGVDWILIINNTEKILSEYSKDLKILTYWLYAQWHMKGWDGLVNTLSIYNSFLEKYKQNHYPKSIKIKKRVIEWIQDSFIIMLIENYQYGDKNVIERIINSFKTIGISLGIIFNDDKLFLFGGLIRKLEAMNKNNIQDETPKIETPKIETPKIETPKIETPKIESEHLSIELTKLKSSIQEYMYKCDDVVELELLLKIGLKELIFFLETNEDIPLKIFPDDKIKNKFRKLIKKEIELDSIHDLKEQLILYPSWLEGYYLFIDIYNFSIMEINDVIVKSMINEFSNKYKTELNIYISTENNLISKDMKKWLDKESDLVLDKKSFYEIEYNNSLQLVTDGNLTIGIKYLDNFYINAKDEEESFQWRLKQAHLSVEGGHKEISLALLFDLEERIKRYNLNVWKPALALKVYKLLLKPIISKELTIELKETFYKKMCKISIQEALDQGFL